MLTRLVDIQLPAQPEPGIDHGDVHLASGTLFIANTGAGAIDIIDVDGCHAARIPNCPEASGVLCGQELGLVFAAARGAGRVLTIDALTREIGRDEPVGSRPNGLAWDAARGHLLVADVADVADNSARVVAAGSGLVSTVPLPGRPRWCVFDQVRDRYLVNIREPALVVTIGAADFNIQANISIASPGPHGLDLDPAGDRAFVACDGGAVIALDLATGGQVGTVPIPGSPDAIWFNPVRQELYVAIEELGILSVIDTRSLELAERVTTEHGCGTTAIDVQRQRLYAFLPESCRVATFAISEPGTRS